NEMVAVWEDAIANASGPQGWSPVFGIASDGERRVYQIVDWVGGEDTKPTLTGYVGATGIVPTIAQGVDVRGPQGVQGDKGDDGDKGNDGDKGDAAWTPIYTAVADGERRVLRIDDWTGGQGT